MANNITVSSIVLNSPDSRKKFCSHMGHELRMLRNVSSEGLLRGQGGSGRSVLLLVLVVDVVCRRGEFVIALFVVLNATAVLATRPVKQRNANVTRCRRCMMNDGICISNDATHVLCLCVYTDCIDPG